MRRQEIPKIRKKTKSQGQAVKMHSPWLSPEAPLYYPASKASLPAARLPARQGRQVGEAAAPHGPPQKIPAM